MEVALGTVCYNTNFYGQEAKCQVILGDFWLNVMSSNDSFGKRKKVVGYLEMSYTLLSSLLYTSPNILVEKCFVG